MGLFTAGRQGISMCKSRGLTAVYRVVGFCFLAMIGSIGCSSDDNVIDGGQGPDSPALVVNDFDSAQSCQSCHPNHFEQWSGSMHAYAMKDPTLAALREIGQSAYINALDGACIQCHSLVARETGAVPWGPFDYDQLPAQIREGVGCDVCHVITGLHSLSNADVLLTPGDTKFGSIQDPVANPAHLSEYNRLYTESEYCGACHDLVTNSGLQLEAVYREWRAGGFAETGKTCSDCHMPAYQGTAAVGGPVRTVHDHRFVGVDLALVDFPNRTDQLRRVTDLLRSALSVEADVPGSTSPGDTLDIQIRLTNDGTGHHVPSGVPFVRQMWLALVLTSGTDTLFATGQLDANDDLMDDHSSFPERDSALFNTQATMYRADGVPTGFVWEADSLVNPAIVAGETRVVDYRMPIPASASGPLRLEMKLHFRSFPPNVIRGLGEDVLLPIPIIDMWEDVRTVGVL